ncbi:MAG TPA: LysM peptidoglycan-binding domain-containing protein [Clostridia bacterium]|nr:LysM peptidoglycan-binding domain-containing protein [Clostridia bacterium]
MLRSLLKRTAPAVLSLFLFLIMTIPAYADSEVLKKGDNSPVVAEVQAALKKLGFFNEECTGYFGKVTDASVREFQKKYKLGADGVLGPATISRINKEAGTSIKLPSRSISSRKDTTSINVRYKIKKGDTIWDIADDYNVSVASILKYNGLAEDSILNIGDEIIIPNVLKVVKAPAPEAKPEDKEPPVEDSSEVGTVFELNKNVYVVTENDTLESIAEDFGVTAEEIRTENNFDGSAQLQPGQEIKIPKGSDVEIKDEPKAGAAASDNKGEYLDWFKEVQYIYEKGDIAIVTDVETGKSFKVKRLYGRNHADSEPLTAEDTKIMKSIYGEWSWDRRAIIVTVEDDKGVERKIAASMNGMPHGGKSIKDNKFGGHFCIHFKNSRTHSGSRLDPGHQKAVKIAAGL